MDRWPSLSLLAGSWKRYRRWLLLGECWRSPAGVLGRIEVHQCSKHPHLEDMDRWPSRSLSWRFAALTPAEGAASSIVIERADGDCHHRRDPRWFVDRAPGTAGEIRCAETCECWGWQSKRRELLDRELGLLLGPTCRGPNKEATKLPPSGARRDRVGPITEQGIRPSGRCRVAIDGISVLRSRFCLTVYYRQLSAFSRTAY
jgi:hypothetical protein